MRYLITTPIYYVNDKPHIGHAYTTLAADVLTRFFRTQGKDVFFLTGTDEHGAKVAESAEKLNKDPKELCDENSKFFKEAWQNLNIEYDYFIRTTDKKHEKKVVEFLNKLKEKRAVYEKKYEGLYCTGCEKFLTGKDLVGGLCPDHKTQPEKVLEKNYFFKLKDYLKKIEDLMKKNKLKIEPENAKKETLGLLKQDLDDFSISRQKEKVKWGIDLPFDRNQIIYVWVDALLNYRTGDGSDNFKKYWQDGYIIHLLAKDILKFHAIYWPAMLLAAGEKIPDEEFIHGFFTIDGQKMSKTLGNVIDPNKLVEKFGTDAARCLLLVQFPFGQDGDIKEKDFEKQYNAFLRHDLGNLISRIIPLINKSKLDIVKIKKDKFSDDAVDRYKRKYEQYMKEFKIYEAFAEVWKLIKVINLDIQVKEPWRLEVDSNELRDFLSKIVYRILVISDLIAPFIPETSEKIKKQLETGESEILFPEIK